MLTIPGRGVASVARLWHTGNWPLSSVARADTEHRTSTSNREIPARVNCDRFLSNFESSTAISAESMPRSWSQPLSASSATASKTLASTRSLHLGWVMDSDAYPYRNGVGLMRFLIHHSLYLSSPLGGKLPRTISMPSA